MNYTLPEIEGYVEVLRQLHADLLKACDGLSGEALNWRPPAADTNSIYVLAAHCAGSQRYWIQQVVGGVDVGRDRSAEFRARGDEFDLLRQQLVAIAAENERTLRQLSEADLRATRRHNDKSYSVQWCILHAIEHLSRHVGHIELTRQWWEGRASE